MVVADTSFMIDLMRDASHQTIVDELENDGSRVVLTAPTVMELWRGAALGDCTEQERTKIAVLLEKLHVLELDEGAAKQAGEIDAHLIQAGKRIDPEDVMIAGIAMSGSETVLTRDAHFTRIPGLRVLKY
ncbi:MAG: PIN domain-containing protein [Candidatus Woesearchaeota archaeon]|nr:PIN domain-containing protein [Candidatus Woesearchaeota archaeon]